jgi:hypothetical protein
MSTMLFSYWITYEVETNHTPFQLVYGLHPLLRIEYLLPSKLGEIVDPTLIWVFISYLLELKFLQKDKLITSSFY